MLIMKIGRPSLAFISSKTPAIEGPIRLALSKIMTKPAFAAKPQPTNNRNVIYDLKLLAAEWAVGARLRQIELSAKGARSCRNWGAGVQRLLTFRRPLALQHDR